MVNGSYYEMDRYAKPITQEEIDREKEAEDNDVNKKR